MEISHILNTPYIRAVKECAEEIFVVGGCIRDAFLKRKCKDFDFLTKEDAELVASKVAKVVDGVHFPLQEEKIFRVLHKDTTLDFVHLDKDILLDLEQRDFRMNAMAIRISDGAFFDPYGGVEDIRERRIRCVKKENFLKDPLRMLRAVRFSAQLGFLMDEECVNAIKEYASFIKYVAPERIRMELYYILEDGAPYLWWLNELGLLSYIFPESVELSKILQEEYHHLDVWTHSLATVEYLEELIKHINAFFPSYGRYFKRYMKEKGVILKLACIVHDFGKKDTLSLKRNGGKQFIAHEKVRISLPYIRLSKKEEELLEKLVFFHMRPGQLATTNITKKAIVRFYRDVGEDFFGLVLLCVADRFAAQGKKVEKEFLDNFLKNMQILLHGCMECKKIKRKKRILSGDDLMKRFLLKPGPLIGELLRKIEEAHLSGKIKKKKEAFEFVERLLREPSFSDK